MSGTRVYEPQIRARLGTTAHPPVTARRSRRRARSLPRTRPATQRDFFIDNLLVRIHFIIVMIRRTGLAP